MFKKFSILFLSLLVFVIPALTRAQEVVAEVHHLEPGDIFFHIASIIFSIIAAVYMLTLVSSFKGGLLEKVWTRFMIISFMFVVLTTALYLQEADILHVDYLTEILKVLISVLLISASYKTLKQVVIKS